MNELCKQKLTTLYAENAAMLQQIQAIVAPHAATIATTFYNTMLANPDGKQFLSHQLVNQRLSSSMTRWISDLFAPRSADEVEAYLAWQSHIGKVHARINIPVRLIGMGMRLLKREISHCLVKSACSREQLAEALMLSNELLDILNELLNQSYLSDVMDNERKAQALRMNVVNNNLAVECERLRSNLFDWHRQVIQSVYGGEQGAPDIHHTQFGLWVVHKAELLFPNDRTVEKLSGHLEAMEKQLQQLQESHHQGDSSCVQDLLGELNKQVSHASWLLSSLVDQLLDAESSRDPLTRVYNRRYLPIIMQRETEISLKHGINYALLFADLDHFKQLNDQYGHDAGDEVLRHFAEQLSHTVRAGDFIFRYGGEEFLVLLTDTDQQEALEVAERVRSTLATQPLILRDGQQLSITTSIGIALNDGYPDYSRVIHEADQALYRAKEAGRNRVECAA